MSQILQDIFNTPNREAGNFISASAISALHEFWGYFAESMGQIVNQQIYGCSTVRQQKSC